MHLTFLPIPLNFLLKSHCLELKQIKTYYCNLNKRPITVRSLCLLHIYALNATSEYQAFVDEVNDALLRVSPTESKVPEGDFNAHVGTDTNMWKGVTGKHGVTGLNENGTYLLQLCCNKTPHHEYSFPAQRG